jgi:hypothetical protein
MPASYFALCLMAAGFRKKDGRKKVRAEKNIRLRVKDAQGLAERRGSLCSAWLSRRNETAFFARFNSVLLNHGKQESAVLIQNQGFSASHTKFVL